MRTFMAYLIFIYLVVSTCAHYGMLDPGMLDLYVWWLLYAHIRWHA